MSFFQPIYGMQPGEHPLRIGAVTFNSDECPAELPIGAGEQKMTVTELIGGGRVIHKTGVQPKPVAWGGQFWYDGTAEKRVTSLRRYMVSGQEVFISYRTEQYYGVVRNFVPSYRGMNVGYQIEIEIIRDANGAFSTAAATSSDAQISNMLADAGDHANDVINNDPNAATVIQPDFSNLQTAIGTVPSVAKAVGANAAAIIASATKALQSAQAYLAILAPLAPGFYAASRLVDILTLIQQTVVAGQSPRTISPQGGDLFELASTLFGDVSLAHDIAIANGLATPILASTAIQDITLPPLSSAPANGSSGP